MHLRSSTKRKHFREFFYVCNVTFGRFCSCKCHALMHVLSFFLQNIQISWRRSLFRISNDTKAIKVVNNCLLQVKRTQFLSILNSNNYNGKPCVSKGKRHVTNVKKLAKMFSLCA